MKIYDRMYGEIKLPDIIMELLNCPGLLRLKDVRMANNSFAAFPAFATTSRYEHSVGVCHLAELCAHNMGLNEKDALELMIAALYHDVGTPPFAHAMEEVLQVKFGFDHEFNLKNLIVGDTGEFDGEMAQIFLGQTLKLRSVCQSREARRYRIDIYRIANLAVGEKSDPLSPLMNANGMDLDNIDNVFRASSAMGLINYDAGEIAEALSKSFLLENGDIIYDGGYISAIREWQRVRDLQYSAIYDSIEDFAYQTMIKKAIRLLLEEDDAVRLDATSWRMTDSEITYNYLLKHFKSKEIMRRVILCKPYSCIGVLYVQGNNTAKYVNKNLDIIEEESSNFFEDFWGVYKGEKEKSEHCLLVNFFPDKRKRALKRECVFMEQRRRIDEVSSTEQDSVLLGFFSSYGLSKYKDIIVDGKNQRKIVSFRKSDLYQLIRVLTAGSLKQFKVNIYNEDKEDGQGNVSETEPYQLGLF